MTTRLKPDAGAARFVGFLPFARNDLIDRAIAQLEKGDLFLVAPAGYGKSALLQTLHDRMSGTRRVAIAEAGNPVAAGNLEDADIVFIDEAEQFGEPDKTTFINWLLSPNRSTRAVIASRSGSCVAAARLSAEQRATVWRSDVLAFTISEITDFLRTSGSGHFQPNMAHELFQRTEGWPLGTAVLSQQGRPRHKTTNLHPNLPPSIREHFDACLSMWMSPAQKLELAAAALPEQISGSLYFALTGSEAFFQLTDSGLDLREVEGAPGWWRFGPQFQQYLRELSGSLGRKRLSELHKAAAEWFLEEDRLPDAAIHALESGDHGYAMDIINRGARLFIAEGQIAHALDWLKHLDEANRGSYPWMWLHRITALALAGRGDLVIPELEALDAHLNQLETSPAPPDWLQEVRLNAMCAHRIYAIFNNQPVPDMEPLGQALASSEAADFPLRGEFLVLQGIVLLERGEIEKGIASLTAGQPKVLNSQSWYAYVLTETTLARRELMSGRLDACRERIDNTRATIVEAAGYDAPCLLPLALVKTHLALLEGDVDQAYRLLALAQGWRSALLSRNLDGEFQALWGLAKLMRGSPREAIQETDRLKAEIYDTMFPLQKAELKRARVLAYLHMQEPDHARREVGDTYGVFPTQTLSNTTESIARLMDAALSAKVMLSNGQAERATKQLPGIIRMAEQKNLQMLALEARLYLIEARAGDRDALIIQREVKAWAEDAIKIGASGLIELHKSGPLSAYLPEARPGQPGQAGASQDDCDVDSGPLTPKEIEILSLITLGYTNKQIADETFIALTTVKWHVRNIFSKMGVQNRTSAVNKARALGLSA